MEIDYTDQSIYSNTYGDRRFTSAFTPYGIKCMDSHYCNRIMNLKNPVDKIYNINRVKDTFIGLDGKEYESRIHYKTVYDEVEVGQPSCGYGIRVVRKDGSRYDYTYYEAMPKFSPNTRMEDPKELRKSIMDNVHLHKDIKENLLSNLKSYENL